MAPQKKAYPRYNTLSLRANDLEAEIIDMALRGRSVSDFLREAALEKGCREALERLERAA